MISESIKPNPDDSVLEWMQEHMASLYLTAITVEELRFGEYLMPKGKRRQALGSWIDSLLTEFSDSILGFDAVAADQCAIFHERSIAAGRVPTIEDLMIAAIASVNGCIVATRNVKDFDFLDVPVVNPFGDQL